MPAFQTRGQFNDNVTLTTQPHSSVWAVWANPSIQLSYATEIVEIRATPEFEFVQYFGDDQNNETFTNFFFPVTLSYLTETDRFGLNGAVNRDNALISELEETGIVTDFIQRQTNTVRGSWDRLVTERLTVQTSYQYRDINYEKGGRSRLFDFQTHTVTFGPRYELTEENQLQSTLFYSNSHFVDIGFRTQSFGGELGVTQRFFETYTVTVNAGGRYVKTTSQFAGFRNKDTDIVWLLNTSLVKEWERSRASVAYSRTLNPSGNGVLLATDRVAVGLNHELTEKITMSLDGSWTMNDTVGSSSDQRRIANTRFWQVRPSVSWRFREDWLLTLAYRRAQRNVQNVSDGTAFSNAVDLAVTYTWPKWAMSR